MVRRYWLSVGAQPSQTVGRLLGQAGIIPKPVPPQSLKTQAPPLTPSSLPFPQHFNVSLTWQRMLGAQAISIPLTQQR